MLLQIHILVVVADLCFVVGALLETVRSYFLFDRTWDYNTALAWVSLIARIHWIVCSGLYLVVTLIQYYCGSWCCGMAPNRNMMRSPSDHLGSR